MSTTTSTIPFYLTNRYPCSYLDHHQARSRFTFGIDNTATQQYNSLIKKGFRRSGDTYYQPACETCFACVPIRVLTNSFVWNRSHKRILNKNQDIKVSITPLVWSDEHYDLYCRYQADRHQETIISDDHTAKIEYQHFFLTSQIDSRFVEFRLNEQLIMVALVDWVRDGLSAVYTFYDPTLNSRSLGTFAVLWQILETQSSKLPYLYLGFWVKESRKMAYKTRFQPYELYINGAWKSVIEL